MKKLYENIEDIYIRGDIGILSEVVTVMDISLQNIAENTEQLTGLLIKYSASNKGTQYEKVVNTSMSLRDELYAASIELNDMQNQIVEYQDKVYRYEDRNETGQKPNPYLVTRDTNISVDTTIIQLNKNEMISIVASLKNYSERVMHYTRIIIEKRNDIASVWRDSQYNIFAEFIDVITGKIGLSLRVFEEYYLYLEDKLKELA